MARETSLPNSARPRESHGRILNECVGNIDTRVGMGNDSEAVSR